MFSSDTSVYCIVCKFFSMHKYSGDNVCQNTYCMILYTLCTSYFDLPLPVWQISSNNSWVSFTKFYYYFFSFSDQSIKLNWAGSWGRRLLNSFVGFSLRTVRKCRCECKWTALSFTSELSKCVCVCSIRTWTGETQSTNSDNRTPYLATHVTSLNVPVKWLRFHLPCKKCVV